MSRDVFDFAWRVPIQGYKWVKTKPMGHEREVFVLTEAAPYKSTRGDVLVWKHYYPLKHHLALFRLFAEIKPNRDGILSFANEYGLLGDSKATVSFSMDAGQQEPLRRGELGNAWLKELHAMRRVVELMDMIAAGDYEGLSSRIFWRDETTVEYSDAGAGSLGDAGVGPGESREQYLIASIDANRELLDRFSFGDLIEPARYYMQRVINRHMHGRVSPRLLWTENRSRMALYFVPGSLIGALWLQCARAIDSDAKFRRCEECGKWFEISIAGGTRTSRVFCSDACRARAYRNRIAEAQRLHKEEGMNPEAIAEQLGSDVDTVKGWIDKEK